MQCIRVTSMPPKGAMADPVFDVVALSRLSKEIKRQIRKGSKSFLLGPLEDRKRGNAVAFLIADLKMKYLDVDFHFFGALS